MLMGMKMSGESCFVECVFLFLLNTKKGSLLLIPIFRTSRRTRDSTNLVKGLKGLKQNEDRGK